MKKQIWIPVLIVIIIVVGVILLSSSRQNNQVNKTQKSVKIGVILPLTGNAQSYGKFAKRGLEMALDEINNEEGGINGRKIKLIYEDSQAQVSVGLSAAQKLINQDKVPAIIGDLISGVTLAIAPVAEKNKVVVLAPGSAVPALTNAGDFIFRLKESADVDAMKLAEAALNKLNFNKIDLIYINNDYGVGVKDGFVKNYQKIGGKIVREESFLQGSTDFRSILSKIKNDVNVNGINAILFVGHSQSTGNFLKQKKEIGINIPVLTHRGSINPDTITIAQNAADGLIFQEEFNTNDKRQVVQKFINQYKLKYNGEMPGMFSAMSYDALKIIAKAIGQCKENSECIRDFLYKQKNYQGVSALITFDENGDVFKDLTLETVKNGKFIPYEQ